MLCIVTHTLFAFYGNKRARFTYRNITDRVTLFTNKSRHAMSAIPTANAEVSINLHVWTDTSTWFALRAKQMISMCVPLLWSKYFTQFQDAIVSVDVLIPPYKFSRSPCYCRV